MADVPFYPNRKDDASCMLAVYRMVIAYFLHKELTWDQLEELSGYQPNRPAWTAKAFTAMVSDYGLSIQAVEPFDYVRFAKEGDGYLYRLFDNEEVKWYQENTNLNEIKPLLPKFIASIRPKCRRPTIDDIDMMLDDGRLVLMTLNGKLLNDQEGFHPHTILIIARSGNTYTIHDPGLPPQASRQVSSDKLLEVLNGTSSVVSIAGFKLRFAGLRLDQFVIREKPSLSRAYATRLVGEGKVQVNGKPNKAGYKLRDGDEVTIDYDEADQPEIPEIDLQVVYEDEDCIVINKPAGVLTHNKGVRFIEATVASFVRGRINQLIGSGERAGIVHRLDRATSGIIIAAKTPEALSFLQKQFHDRTVQKTYSAVIQGQIKPDAAVIDMPIERNPKAPATFRVGANGKTAQTQYQTVRTSSDYSLLELQPKTGRTHQLRVHLANQHHPIVGDILYGGEVADRMYLHAHQLKIKLPNGDEKTFTAPIPDEFILKVA